MGLLFREHQRLTFVVVFEEVSFLVYIVITAHRIFAVFVNDVYKFYYMCMVKFINLRFVNYYLFFRKFI